MHKSGVPRNLPQMELKDEVSRPHQSKGMRNGKKKKFMELRPDSACIPITKGKKDKLTFETSGEQEVRLTGQETGFFNDGAPVNEMYDVECSTRKANTSDRMKGLGQTYMPGTSHA